MTDTAEGDREAPAPYPMASVAKNGQRGRVLRKMREDAGIGQTHIGALLDPPLTQPDVSRIEREVYGGVPRGFGGRYLAALATIAAARGGACFDRCGCTKQ